MPSASGMGRLPGMPANPTRKTEVQAHRFEVRRMSSALVRRDPVMVHDPLRTHSRASMVGAILGAVGLLAFLLFGILSPKPKPPDAGIVIAKGSGQIFVKLADPEMLIPTFNLASARLILMGTQSQNAEQPQDVKAFQPEVVPDDRLDGMRRGRLQGIPGASMLLPTLDQRISDNWAVCHHLPVENSEDLQPGPKLDAAIRDQKTAVLAGVAELGTPLDAGVGILVQLADRKTMQLIYRPEEDANRKSEMVRATVPDAPSVREALALRTTTPRPMSLGLLNALEDVGVLNAPQPAGLGEQTQYDLGLGGTARVGDVFRKESPGQADEYYVILRGGKQKVTHAVAAMMRHEYSTDARIPVVRPEVLNNVPDDEELEVAHYPEQIPTVLDPLEHPTTCLGWTIDEDGDGRTTVYSGSELPYPEGATPTEIGQANEDRILLDEVYMPPGRGAVIRAATSAASFGSGVIQLVSDAGLRYGIPDPVTAAHLGLTDIQPAPASIVKLLPAGTSLSPQEAARTFDAVRVEAAEDGDYDPQGAPSSGG